MPEKDGARLFDYVEQRVVFKPYPDRGRDHIGRIKHRARIHKHHADRAGCELDIAQKHSQGGKQQGDPECYGNERQEGHQKQQGVRVQAIANRSHGGQDDDKADAKLVECRTEIGQGENFQGEDHFFYQVGLADHRPRRTYNDLGNGLENRDAKKYPQSVVNGGLSLDAGVVAFEYKPKDNSIDAHHQEGIEHTPENPNGAAAMTLLNLAFGGLPKQVAVLCENFDHFSV